MAAGQRSNTQTTRGVEKVRNKRKKSKTERQTDGDGQKKKKKQ